MGYWLKYPIRPGLFEELDRIAETTTDLVDLLPALVERGAGDAWNARAAALQEAAANAVRDASTSLAGGSDVAFIMRLFALLQAQRRVWRSVWKVGSRLWACPASPGSVEARASAESALVLSAAAVELRAAVRCLGAPGRRPEAVAHCGEARRMSRAARTVARQVPRLAHVQPAEVLVGTIAWESAFSAMADASAAIEDAAALVAVIAAEL